MAIKHGSDRDLEGELESARASHDPAALERLVKRFLPMIRPIAGHFATRRPDLYDDLVQVGSIGLLRAIERFDPALGKPFEAYASTLIAGEMRHYLRDAVPLVRPPRELVELRGRVLAAREGLAGDGRDAGAAAIAAYARLPVGKVEEVLALEENFVPASIDQELDGDGSGSLRYQLVDNRYKSFQLATEDRLIVEQNLGKLRAVSREVIEFAFYEDLTQTEIAKKLGISQMQVSRRLKSALGELWKVFNTRVF